MFFAGSVKIVVRDSMELGDCSVEMQVRMQLNLLIVLYIWRYDTSMYLFVSVRTECLCWRQMCDSARL